MASNPKVITAEEFRLVSKDGKTLARLGIDVTGSPLLSFNDRNGINRVFLGVSNNVATLTLHDSERHACVYVSLFPNGELSLEVYNKDQRKRADARMDADGNWSLELTDQGGKIIWPAQ